MPRPYELFQCRVEDSAHIGVDTLGEQMPGHSYTQVCADFAILIEAVGNGRRIERVNTTNCFVDDTSVGDFLCQRADLIQRRTKRNSSRTRDRAIGRFESNQAGERGWLADRATCIGPESE